MNARIDDLLHGVVPITARREAWMEEALADHGLLSELVDTHGSPVNLIDPSLLVGHAAELVDAAAALDVDLRIQFARKANKSLALVDAALAGGHGIDVASERELAQVLARLERSNSDADPADRVILTAAVKPAALLELAVAAGVTICVDNTDELDALLAAATAADPSHRVPVVLRLQPVLDGKRPSRFGMPAARIGELLSTPVLWERLRLVGLHFHLDGYEAEERSEAIVQALALIETARAHGHTATYVDMGGGIPIRYVDGPDGWSTFWARHRGADRLTWQNRELGKVYPVWQEPIRGAWLERVLTQNVDGRTVAQRLRSAGVSLHCEPGRALADGCGLTVARVESRKQQIDGTWLIGLAMNRTQCRSAADDFLVDPILVPRPDVQRTEPGEGYLVGAYCIEAELLTWRRMQFPVGVAVGDLVVFVNTGGYQMHILESSSHQIPLARNVVRGGSGSWVLDPIDGGEQAADRSSWSCLSEPGEGP